jgi:hypothetical protein
MSPEKKKQRSQTWAFCAWICFIAFNTAVGIWTVDPCGKFMPLGRASAPMFAVVSPPSDDATVGVLGEEEEEDATAPMVGEEASNTFLPPMSTTLADGMPPRFATSLPSGVRAV